MGEWGIDERWGSVWKIGVEWRKEKGLRKMGVRLRKG